MPYQVHPPAVHVAHRAIATDRRVTQYHAVLVRHVIVPSAAPEFLNENEKNQLRERFVVTQILLTTNYYCLLTD